MIMKKQYQLTGMTCTSCEAKVKQKLLTLDGLNSVVLSHEENSAEIHMDRPIPLEELKSVLRPLGDKYSISFLTETKADLSTDFETDRSWLETYKPILLIFFYLLAVTLSVQLYRGSFDLMIWMHHFMGGFFLVFSFFKMLDLKGFAQSYQMYDVIARKFPTWGYIYAFTELALGLAFILFFQPLITYSLTLVVMSISIIGVLQTVLDKKKIQCACLGSVFKLPMSTVTIIEDGLMIVMSAYMLLQLF
jgi:copper chaperone CopZ